MGSSVKEWFKLIAHFTWSGLAIVVRSLTGILVNKLIAIYFGAVGLGLFAHLQNLVVFFMQIPQEGINRGLIALLADTKEQERQRDWFTIAALLSLCSILLFALILWLGSAWFLRFIEAAFPLSIGWVILAVAFMMGTFFFQSLLIARSKLLAYFLASLTGSGVLIIVVAFAGRQTGSLEAMLLAWLLGLGGLTGTAFVASLIAGVIPRWRFSLAGQGFGYYGQYLIMALVMVTCGRGVDFIVRQYAFDTIGLATTGLWQGAVRLSEGYLMLFAGITSAVVYPRIAALQHEAAALRGYLLKIYGLLSPVLLIGLGLIYWQPAFWLELLLSADLRAAAQYTPGYLLADGLMMPGWIISYWLLATRRTPQYIIAQVIPALGYLVYIYQGLATNGPEALVEAYLLKSVLFVLLVLSFSLPIFRKS